MATFRRFGGIGYAATQNIVKSNYSSNRDLSITGATGLPNTKEVSYSHQDLNGNSLLNVQTLYFMDGTSISSAPTQTFGALHNDNYLLIQHLIDEIQTLKQRILVLETETNK